jgi:N-formylglutamate amidohydrolase
MSAVGSITRGDGPVVAAAIHAGHSLTETAAVHIALPEAERLREEDPFTDRFTRCAPTRVTGVRSRFEVDLNRTRQECVYLEEGLSWGQTVWRGEPPPQVIEAARQAHDRFYDELYEVLRDVEERHGGFVLLDLHSYNHLRSGIPADTSKNPEVNLGTGTVDHGLWGSLVERFAHELARGAGGLDVRENIKFKGRFLAAWVHATFPWTGCCLAVEFKKTFMNELTGELFPARLKALTDALSSTVPGLEDEVSAVMSRPSARTG